MGGTERFQENGIIQIENLVKRYGSFVALDHLNLNVREGEIFGLLGPNGLRKIHYSENITGVLAPTAGTVTVNGRISALLELGAGFNPEYSGMENIFLNGTM